ncbi:hypothetical protein FQR65_LT19484 [Abscondita terminalis]|nr:hypothetical protein FQR65_LT19484 [Abscondita terminalis]
MDIVAMKVSDAVIFITGANRGLGLALAQEAVRRGAQKVYAGMRNIADFNQQGIIPVVVDVTDPISIQNAVAQCGDVSILVNNAGIARLNQSPVEANIVATTQTILETNLYGVVNTTQYFSPILENKSESYIVNILSDVSWEPSTLLPVMQFLKLQLGHLPIQHVNDLTQTLDIPKISPSTVAQQVFEGIENNAFEVLVGASTQALKKGYGHTKVIAETFAAEIDATLIEIDQEGNIQDQDWDTLDAADAIVFGAPTYMANAPWQFKKFADASSKRWFTRAWTDKIFGGFTNSASLNGDKQVTLISLQTLASQHGGIWVSLGLLPANTKDATRQDVNNLGGSVGLLVQSPSDASVEEIPSGDLETAKAYAKRIQAITDKFIA